MVGADLLLEIANSVIVGVSEEMIDADMRLPNIVLKMVHEMRSIALHTAVSFGLQAG